MITVSNEKIILSRLAQLSQNLKPDSPATHIALMKAGNLIANEAKLNVRRQRLIDTGRLFNSIAYRIVKNRLEVGSFGVPYAARWELGFDGVDQVREHTRRYRSGTVAKVRSHERKVNIKARPYLRPALEKNIHRIVKIFGEAVFETKI